MTNDERLDWLCRLRSGLVWFDVPPKERPMFNEALSETIQLLKCIEDIKAEIEKQIERDHTYAMGETAVVKAHDGSANGLQVAIRIIDRHVNELRGEAE